MIGLRQSTRFLNRSMQTQGRYASMVKTSQRGFAGGADKPAMSADNTDFDILFVGKLQLKSGLQRELTNMDLLYRWRRCRWSSEDHPIAR